MNKFNVADNGTLIQVFEQFIACLRNNILVLDCKGTGQHL